jgi:hypothetical protein
LKRHVAPAAAALAAALVSTGSALAQRSLIPDFAGDPHAWLVALQGFPLAPRLQQPAPNADVTPSGTTRSASSAAAAWTCSRQSLPDEDSPELVRRARPADAGLGGAGVVWTARQMWYVAGGLRHIEALPEIYSSEMAQEWAELARIAHSRFHRGVSFAGVMTQGTASCDCGLRPEYAHRVLADALASVGEDETSLPAAGTNIVGS